MKDILFKQTGYNVQVILIYVVQMKTCYDVKLIDLSKFWAGTKWSSVYSDSPNTRQDWFLNGRFVSERGMVH